ncbi:MAG: ABC transporter ATP-binding protein [Acidobacteriota bacterium]
MSAAESRASGSADRRPPPAVEVRGLRKAYGSKVVLNRLDLDIEAGETLVILGGSGSGKSTLLRCLIGLEKPDAGSVRLHGVDLFSSPPDEILRLRQRLGVAFQGGALFGSMTVAGNVDLPLAEFTDLPPSTRRIVARIKLSLVGLEDAMDRFPSELSGGMQKRAAFARAMALDPDLLFCDEPSAGLDPVTAAELDELLIRLKGVFGVTLVVVTHELDSAFKVADRMALMRDGRFAASGTPEQIRASADPWVRRFLDRLPEPEEDDRERRYRKLISQWENEP